MRTYKFKCAAIQIFIDDKEKIFEGYSHIDIMNDIISLGYRDFYEEKHINGFMIYENNKLKFFNRYQSTNIAKRLGIIGKDVPQLISDDLRNYI